WNSLPTSNAAPDIIVGQASSSTGDSGTTAAKLSLPVAAAIANGKLFVVDQNNDRVLIWKSVPASSGAAADLVIGQPAFTSSNTSTTTASDSTLNLPGGMWTDGFQILVADSGNNRVLYWSQIPAANGGKATYVIGQGDFARVTSGVSAAQFFTPYG